VRLAFLYGSGSTPNQSRGCRKALGKFLHATEAAAFWANLVAIALAIAR
jgi:hypothetical protein